MNGLTAIGMVLASFGFSLFALTIIIANIVTSPYSISAGSLSICIMMMVGGIVLILYGGMGE